MRDNAKNIIIGIFAASAIGIIVFILLFLHPSIGDMRQTLQVRFTNIDKVSKGTRVNFAGKPVGEVVDIREVPEARTDQQYRKGDVYIYELTLKLDSGVEVFESDDISIRTSGLLGERSIEITPRPTKPHQLLRQVTDQEIIFASSTGSVEDALQSLDRLTKKIGRSLDAVTSQIKELEDEKLIQKFTRTIENIKDITGALNQPDKLKAMVEDLAAGAANFRDAATNFNRMGESASAVATRIQNGEGSIGKLLAKEEFYLRLNSVLSKADTTLNDINHYGVLFHNDKGWQRLRARRANLMQQLSSPASFRNFFNDEIDSISTSLARVFMLMQETDNSFDPNCVIPCREFLKVFADFLQNVEGLEDNLKLYNQQLQDKRTDFECGINDYGIINCQ